jgi:hypothetical protein
MKTTYPLKTLKPEFVRIALAMTEVHIDNLTIVATIQDVFAKLHEKGMDFSLDDALEIIYKNRKEEPKTSANNAKMKELQSIYRSLSECYVHGSTNKINLKISEKMDRVLVEIEELKKLTNGT